MMSTTMGEHQSKTKLSPGTGKLLLLVMIIFILLFLEGLVVSAQERMPYLESSLHQKVENYLLNRGLDVSTIISLASQQSVEPGMLLLLDFLHHEESSNELMFFSEQDKAQKERYLHDTLSCNLSDNVSCQITHIEQLLNRCPTRALCPQFQESDDELVSDVTCVAACSLLEYTDQELSSLYSYFTDYIAQEHRLSLDAHQRDVTQGLYQFIPEFSTTIQFSLDMFHSIRTQAQQLSDTCRDAHDLRTCLENELTRYNAQNSSRRLWYIDKTSPLDSLFYSYVEFLEACEESPYNRCVCNYTFSIPSSTQEFLSMHDITSLSIKHEPQENETRLSLELLGQSHVETVPFIISQNDSRLSVQQPYSMELDFSRNGEFGGYQMPEISGFDSKRDTPLYLRKAMHSPQKYVFTVNEKDGTESRTCGTYQRHETFGVVDFSSQIMPFTQTLYQRTVFQPPIYSFALFFGDDKAPSQLPDVQIQNLPNASDKVIVSFGRPLDDDLKEIAITFASEETISHTFTRYISFVQNQTVDAINLDQPLVEPMQPLQFEAYIEDVKQNITLNSSALYYDMTDQRYFVVLDRIPPAEYTASLVPIDLSGNRNDSLREESQISFEAFYDMPPAPVRNLSFRQNSIHWSDVTRLINGSGYDKERDGSALPVTYELYCTTTSDKEMSTWELYGTTTALQYPLSEEKRPKRCMVLAVDQYENSYHGYSDIETVVIT